MTFGPMGQSGTPMQRKTMRLGGDLVLREHLFSSWKATDDTHLIVVPNTSQLMR